MFKGRTQPHARKTITVQPDHEHQKPLIDVAVIGAGVAGAYTAYRLKMSNHGLDVRLFEASDRIGGRLWSHRFSNTPGQVAEMGGMYFYEHQQNLYGLCSELKLTMDKEPFESEWRQYQRAHRFPFEELARRDRPKNHYPEVIPYFLRENEKWKYPAELVLQALEEKVPGISERFERLDKVAGSGDIDGLLRELASVNDFLYTSRIAEGHRSGARPLTAFGFWNYLAAGLSYEAFSLIQDTVGLSSVFCNRNLYDACVGFAVDMLPVPQLVVREGYDAVPKRLVEEFRDVHHGVVEMQTQLYKLDLGTVDGAEVIELTIGTPGSPEARHLNARHVVLAVPPRALELLDPDSCIFENPGFRADMNSVTAHPASKLYMTYRKPWWKDVGITGGRTATDLPLRTTIYLGAEEDGNALLLASLSDSSTAEFWDGFLDASRFGERNIPHLFEGEIEVGPQLKAPARMVAETQRQLKELHDLSDIPDPVGAAYFNWMTEPFGGAWHFWNPHVDSREVIPRIRRPLPEANIYLCGEAFSAAQGWVEGALNTAEMVLEEYFGLPRPDRLPSSYALEPSLLPRRASAG